MAGGLTGESTVQRGEVNLQAFRQEVDKQRASPTGHLGTDVPQDPEHSQVKTGTWRTDCTGREASSGV